ncbi:MAG: SpoIIE family protein phosphatase [Candidatus ainarchaeum sp.]|nr:SpoIIE family protein phosphatase [Candidatus ainarchaeum sp.]
MEKLIAGTKITASGTSSASTAFCDFSVLVKKGHEECGDSAFAYSDAEKTILAIFDGVSGEPNAASASSAAASAALKHLKALDRCDERQMKDALMEAQLAVAAGYTTAIILFVEKSGRFLVAGVGDSPAYGISANGEISLEIPLARMTDDGDSIFKFFHFRSIVTAVLGPSGQDVPIRMRSGKLEKGDVILLASDGLTDNLWVKVHGGYVKDSSGIEDLKALIGKERAPQKIVRMLMNEASRRIKAGKKEKTGEMLVPKQDDIAIAALRFK